MAGQSILISLMLNVLLGLTLCSNPESETYKCCMPDQWGGTLFISSGTSIVFFNWTIYTNGTAVFAYDKKLGKLYLGMEVIHHSPQLPQNPHINWTILYDNKKGIMYDVSSGECDKTPVDKNAIHHMSCIPANAELLSRATLSDDKETLVTTYRFPYPADNNDVTVTATVKQEGESSVCVPVVITYVSSVTTQGGLMYNFDVYDIGPINSTDVFNVPKPCV